MGVKVMLDYPRDGVLEEYPEADGWLTDEGRTLTVAFEKDNGRGYTDTVKLAQYNSDRWQKVWMYDPEPTVGEDTNEELEPPL